MYLILHDGIIKSWRKWIRVYTYLCPRLTLPLPDLYLTFITSQQNREGSAFRHGLLSMCCFVRRTGDLFQRGKHSTWGWVPHPFHNVYKTKPKCTKSGFLKVLIQLFLLQVFHISLWNPNTCLWRPTCPWAWAVWPTALQSLSGSSGCRMVLPSTP